MWKYIIKMLPCKEMLLIIMDLYWISRFKTFKRHYETFAPLRKRSFFMIFRTHCESASVRSISAKKFIIVQNLCQLFINSNAHVLHLLNWWFCKRVGHLMGQPDKTRYPKTNYFSKKPLYQFKCYMSIWQPVKNPVIS